MNKVKIECCKTCHYFYYGYCEWDENRINCVWTEEEIERETICDNCPYLDKKCGTHAQCPKGWK